jgi:hypothetical protein
VDGSGGEVTGERRDGRLGLGPSGSAGASPSRAAVVVMRSLDFFGEGLCGAKGKGRKELWWIRGDALCGGYADLSLKFEV